MLSGVLDSASSFVIYKHYRFRQYWNRILSVLLLYTGTVFPFHLAFLEMNVSKADAYKSSEWELVEYGIDALWWFDLVATFFFTYDDKYGKEVDSLKKIVINYLTGFFLINFLSCMPLAMVVWVLGLFTGIDSNPLALNKGLRIARLQRISRLFRAFVRLSSLKRMSSISTFLADRSKAWQVFGSYRSMRIFNFVCGLFWVAHMLACGWYLVAACHRDTKETWLGRREISSSGETLHDAGPFEQWVHSMYFVLTVFTTVGFGDISPLSTAEILYCVCMMLTGIVVNSVFLSEVINILTTVDKAAKDLSDQKELVQQFGIHTELSRDTMLIFKRWLKTTRTIDPGYNRDGMKRILATASLPTELQELLVDEVFGGALPHNQFMCHCGTNVASSLRLVLFTALVLSRRYYLPGEMVYSCNDHAGHLFLVMTGTFSYLARPTSSGGVAKITKTQVASIVKGFAGFVDSNLLKLEGIAEKRSEESVDVSPYKLFGVGTYFGESEIVLQNMGSSRHSCARCEGNLRTGLVRGASSLPTGYTPPPNKMLEIRGNSTFSVDSLAGESTMSLSGYSGGSLLILAKADLTNLLSEFPESIEPLRLSAKRRESHRLIMLARLNSETNAALLAAAIIQREVRVRLLKTQPRGRTDGCTVCPQDEVDVVEPACDPEASELLQLRTEISRLRNVTRKDLDAHSTRMDEKMKELQETIHALRGDLSQSMPIMRDRSRYSEESFPFPVILQV